MLKLTRKQILPAVSAYAKELSETAIAKKTACPGGLLRNGGGFDRAVLARCFFVR